MSQLKESINLEEFLTKIDQDQTGYITRSDLRDFLIKSPVCDGPLTNEMVDSLLDNVDQNINQYINKDEIQRVVNITVGPGRQSMVQRVMVTIVYYVAPRSQISHGQRRYISKYSCCPPPIVIPLICAIQIGVFLFCGSTDDKHNGDTRCLDFYWYLNYVYDPKRREEVWRFISYTLLHADNSHLVQNIVPTLLLGIPLEMVHSSWRISIIYIAGVISGPLALSMFLPKRPLVGSSGGLYALVAAHIGNTIINWSEMKFRWQRLLILLVLMAVGIYLDIDKFPKIDDSRDNFTQNHYMIDDSRDNSTVNHFMIDDSRENSTLNHYTIDESGVNSTLNHYTIDDSKIKFNLNHYMDGIISSIIVHLAGAVAGLLMGIATLRNLKEHQWEKALRWTVLIIFTGIIITGFIIQIYLPDMVGALNVLLPTAKIIP